MKKDGFYSDTPDEVECAMIEPYGDKVRFAAFGMPRRKTKINHNNHAKDRKKTEL